MECAEGAYPPPPASSNFSSDLGWSQDWPWSGFGGGATAPNCPPPLATLLLITWSDTPLFNWLFYHVLLQSISLTHPRLVQSLTATWPVLSTLQSNIVIKWPPEHFIVSNFMYITIFLLSFTQGVGRSELQLCTTDKWQCLGQWY